MLDSDSAAFIQTGVSISIAACRPDGLASMSRGLGCKVVDGGRQVAVFVNGAQAAELLANIRGSGRVAGVFSLPSSNRTVQLKGSDARVLPFDTADLSLITAHIDDFVREVVSLGMAERVVRTVFAFAEDDLATVVYSPCAAFSQTPGPRAGEPLERLP